ncbi:hypothetical protein H9P43_002988 [Blastocladiella emersonii ATCC 22665]|nr:hypothetical protein H9P43_002988 [Blastocladiella emersonii ATCC 22665]
MAGLQLLVRLDLLAPAISFRVTTMTINEIPASGLVGRARASFESLSASRSSSGLITSSSSACCRSVPASAKVADLIKIFSAVPLHTATPSVAPAPTVSGTTTKPFAPAVLTGNTKVTVSSANVKAVLSSVALSTALASPATSSAAISATTPAPASLPFAAAAQISKEPYRRPYADLVDNRPDVPLSLVHAAAAGPTAGTGTTPLHDDDNFAPAGSVSALTSIPSGLLASARPASVGSRLGAHNALDQVTVPVTPPNSATPSVSPPTLENHLPTSSSWPSLVSAFSASTSSLLLGTDTTFPTTSLASLYQTEDELPVVQPIQLPDPEAVALAFAQFAKVVEAKYSPPARVGSRTSAAVRRATVAVRQVAQSAKRAFRKTLGSTRKAKPVVSQDGRAATVANVAAALELQHSQDVVGGARQQVDQHHGVAQQQIDDGQVLDEQAPHHGVGTEEDLAQSQVNGGDAVPEPDHHADGSEQQEVDGGHAHGHADGQAGSEDPLSMPEMLDCAAEKGDEFACPDRVGGVGVRDAEVDEVEASNVSGLGRALAAKLPIEYYETLVRIKRDLPNVLLNFVGQYFGYAAAAGESVLSHEAVERLAALVREHRKAPGEIALMGLMFSAAATVSDKREVRVLYNKKYAKDVTEGTAAFATAPRVMFPDLFDTPERVADVVPYLQYLARIDDALVVAAVTRREDPDVPSRQLAAAALLHLTANQFVVADEQRSDALMGMYYLIKFIGRESQL